MANERKKQKLIEIKGLLNTTDDYNSEDGKLSVCNNMLAEQDGYRVASTAQSVIRSVRGRIIYVHVNSSFGKNYIALDDSDSSDIRLYCYRKSGDEYVCSEITMTDEGGAVTRVKGKYVGACAVGKVMIIVTDSDKYYYLYKQSGYEYLGTHLPELSIDFTSQGYFYVNGRLNVDKTSFVCTDGAQGRRDELLKSFCVRPLTAYCESLSYSIAKYFDDFPSDNWDSVTCKSDESDNNGKDYPTLLTDVCFGALNKTIAYAREQGLSVMPRLVRAAWRLYDGSYAMYTTPVLLYNFGTRNATILEGANENSKSQKSIACGLYPYTIDYMIHNDITKLKQMWGDIIKGVTIFAGSEIYDYDQSGKVTTLDKTFSSAITKTESSNWGEDTYTYDMILGSAHYTAQLPRPSEADQLDKIRDSSPFYRGYDRDLGDVANQYVQLQLKRVQSGDSAYKDVLAHTLTFKLHLTRDKINDDRSVTSETEIKDIVINVRKGDNFVLLYDRIRQALADAELQVELHKMYVSQWRRGKHLKPYELCVAIIGKEGWNVRCISLSSEGSEGDNAQSLNVFALSCYGQPIPSDDFPSATLETQEHINDDYRAHVDVLPACVSAYNQRLMQSNLTIRYRDYTQSAGVVLPDVRNVINNSYPSAIGFRILGIAYYLKIDGEDVVVGGQLNCQYSDIHLLYYPDVRCYKAVINCDVVGYNSEPNRIEVRMRPSKVLNGAIAIDKIPYNDLSVTVSEDGLKFTYSLNFHTETDFSDKAYYSSDQFVLPDEYGTEHLGGVVLTSKVSNPFVWEAKGECTVGSSEVVALCGNTNALSSGQFGQHPIFAFTSAEGVWACQIGDDGQLVAIQPLSRDILISTKSLCQMDDSVVYATRRGLLEQSGKQNKCVSDELNKTNMQVSSSLPGYDKLLLLSGIEEGELPSATDKFETYLLNSEMTYDYLNQRLLLFNSAYAYAYIYSFKSARWSTIRNDFASAVNSYPEALAMSKSGDLVDISTIVCDWSTSDDSGSGDEETKTTNKGLIVTRPIKIDSPEELETLLKSYLRGKLSKRCVKQVWYASRDMVNWVVVGSSASIRMEGNSGSAYKYFVCAMVCEMTSDEYLSAIAIEYMPKYNNKLR